MIHLYVAVARYTGATCRYNEMRILQVPRIAFVMQADSRGL